MTGPGQEPFQGHSGLLYDLQDMSPTSANQATSGMGADFIVDRVRQCESHQGTYYAFQMNRPESVRIFDPTERGQRVECTCEEFQTGQAVCTHVYVSPASWVNKGNSLKITQWLFDGLNAVLRTPATSGTQAVSRGNVVTQISALYGLIGSQLSSLPAYLSATHDEVASDMEDVAEIVNSPTFPSSRAEQMRDMLSVFDPTILPEDYGRDFGTMSASNGRPNLYVPNNLAATIFQLGVHDESVFECLRKVITHDICASVQLSKQRARAREAFAELDSYIENGPSDGPQDEDQDVPRCANTLRYLVDQICQIRNSRSFSGPLSAGVKRRVAEVLVEILQEVCNRNEDVYYRIDWERDVADDELDRNRNLYAYVIDDPPRLGPSTPNWMKDTFVVDRLRQMPADEWRHLIERLTSIVDQIREFLPNEDDPPRAYTKLERMIQDYTAEAFEPSSSSVQRRPTLGYERESQRRRFE
ncbi:MAG: hypothetical protein Q9200_006851 [Gallowayella weberi]